MRLQHGGLGRQSFGVRGCGVASAPTSARGRVRRDDSASQINCGDQQANAERSRYPNQRNSLLVLFRRLGVAGVIRIAGLIVIIGCVVPRSLTYVSAKTKEISRAAKLVLDGLKTLPSPAELFFRRAVNS